MAGIYVGRSLMFDTCLCSHTLFTMLNSHIIGKYRGCVEAAKDCDELEYLKNV